MPEALPRRYWKRYSLSASKPSSDPPAALRSVEVHRALGLALPVVPVSDNVTVLMALSGCILIIEHESDRAVGIIVDTVLNPLRKLLCHQRIRYKDLSLIFAVCRRAELVCVVALDVSVS